MLGAATFFGLAVLPATATWSRAGNIIGDGGNLLLGALFGAALGRTRRLDLLREPAVFDGLCLMTAYIFVTAGFVKALFMQGMSDFFTQSGYSLGFLKFIMTAEVLGGAALLRAPRWPSPPLRASRSTCSERCTRTSIMAIR